MGKQKPGNKAATPTKKAAKPAAKKTSPAPAGWNPDRSERIGRGKEVLKLIRERIEKREGERSKDIFDDQSLAARTRQRYEAAVVAEYAAKHKFSSVAVEVDVQLATLVDLVETEDDKLVAAIVSGRLHLNRKLLTDLLDEQPEQLPDRLQSLLKVQV